MKPWKTYVVVTIMSIITDSIAVTINNLIKIHSHVSNLGIKENIMVMYHS